MDNDTDVSVSSNGDAMESYVLDAVVDDGLVSRAMTPGRAEQKTVEHDARSSWQEGTKTLKPVCRPWRGEAETPERDIPLPWRTAEAERPEREASVPFNTSSPRVETNNYSYAQSLEAGYIPREDVELESITFEQISPVPKYQSQSTQQPNIVSSREVEAAKRRGENGSTETIFEKTTNNGDTEEYSGKANEINGGKETEVSKKFGEYDKKGKCGKKSPNIEKGKEREMWKIVREIVLYLLFLVVQMSVTYRTITPQSFLMKVNLENIFIKENLTTKMPFNKMRNTDEFWLWARTGFLNGLHVSREYNPVPPSSLPGFINDGVSYVVGFATMRQLRVRPGLCRPYYMLRDSIEECSEQYKESRKDRRTYGPGWVPLPENSTHVNGTNVTLTPYVYRSASTIQGYPYWGHRHLYGGGGYVVELNGNRSVLETKMATLEREGWIDKHTRAVFVEFTVYNPNVNFFCIATILVEFAANGGALQSYRFEPAVLLTYRSHAMVFQVICEFAFFAFTVGFIVIQVRELIKQRMKYFKCFWHYVELLTIFCAILSIVVYFYKFAATKHLTRQINKTKGTKYMKFQYVGYWNELFYYIFGWAVFFGVLKFIRLLRFNKRMFMLSGTWRYGARGLLHFSVIFWILFLAFAQLFYLTFARSMFSFRHIIASSQSCFTMLLGIFDIHVMTMISPLLAKFYIFLFVLTMMFVILNMFMSILNETFDHVRQEIARKQNKYEIIEFLGTQLKVWGGISRRTLRRTPRQLNNQLRRLAFSRKRGTINTMDRLLNSIHRSRLRLRSEDRRMTKNKNQQNLHQQDSDTEVRNKYHEVNYSFTADIPADDFAKIICDHIFNESHVKDKTVNTKTMWHSTVDMTENKTCDDNVLTSAILHGKVESNRLARKNMIGNQPSYKATDLTENDIP